jgi:hypothetical protein
MILFIEFLLSFLAARLIWDAVMVDSAGRRNDCLLGRVWFCFVFCCNVLTL